jgi:predicted nucleic acid-binding Zn ribbon protein
MHRIDYLPIGTQKVMTFCGKLVDLDRGTTRDDLTTCRKCRQEIKRRRDAPPQ